MKRIIIYLIAVVFTCTACKNEVSLSKDKDAITASSQSIISKQINKQCINADSFELLDIHNENGEAVIVFSTHVKYKNGLNKSEGLWISAIEKDKEGFKLSGASGSIGDSVNDVNAEGVGNNIYGTISNKDIETIRLIYADEVVIDIDVKDKDFFYNYREDVKESGFPYIKGLNKEGEVLYDSSNGTV